ncbi:MAG: hypothetical protein IT580_09455 [Verrucomicrobiales bacterium]|nr:hypothetical protein [Verrucomicrobiales bacterium]
MKHLAFFAALAALTLGASVASAKEPKINTEAVKALTGVPAAELPAVAASVVTSMPQASRAAALDAVMRRVGKTNPAALRHVAAAIAKADSSLAAAAAAMAAKVNPQSVGAIAASTCTAAPAKASQILAACSRVTVTSTSALAEVVAKSNPVFVAETLARDAAVEVSSDAGITTGGTVILPFGAAPGTLGYDIQGNDVTTAPPSAGPAAPGFDPDRYGAAGS